MLGRWMMLMPMWKDLTGIVDKGLLRGVRCGGGGWCRRGGVWITAIRGRLLRWWKTLRG